MNQVAAIVLAAGRGTRVKAPADVNKVAFTLADKPMVTYSIDNLRHSGVEHIIVVVGHAKESVMKAIGDTVHYAIQDQPLGTGHAFQAGLVHTTAQTPYVLSLYGDDSAFYSPELIQHLVQHHVQTKAAVTFLTLRVAQPHGLGRIVRDSANRVLAIVEEKNATEEQKKIQEVNTGLYCFSRDFALEAIKKVKKNPVSGEYYLTDLIELANQSKLGVETFRWPDADCWFGVNTREQLEEADQRMQAKRRS